MPSNLTYGGDYFNVSLSSSDVGNKTNLENTKVVVIRVGYSTHAMNM